MIGGSPEPGPLIIPVATGRSGSRLAEAVAGVALGDWTSYYLALLRGVDPTPIEAIDRLKERLAAAST